MSFPSFLRLFSPFLIYLLKYAMLEAVRGCRMPATAPKQPPPKEINMQAYYMSFHRFELVLTQLLMLFLCYNRCRIHF